MPWPHVERTYKRQAEFAANALRHSLLKGRRREGASRVAYDRVMREHDYMMRLWRVRGRRPRDGA